MIESIIVAAMQNSLQNVLTSGLKATAKFKENITYFEEIRIKDEYSKQYFEYLKKKVNEA